MKVALAVITTVLQALAFCNAYAHVAPPRLIGTSILPYFPPYPPLD